MNIISRISLVSAALWAVAGCGQKGPLYLPGDPSDVRTEIPELPNRPDTGQSTNDSEENDDDETGDATEREPR